MAFFTLSNGGTTLTVEATSFERAESDRQGEQSRAADSTLRSSLVSEKRSWLSTTRPMLEAEAAAIEALIALDAIVTLSGDAVALASILVMVRVSTSGYIKDGSQPTDYQRSLALTIREV